MSEGQGIMDAMLSIWSAAATEGRRPIRWEINDAGLTRLAMDPRVAMVDLQGQSLIDRPFLGIPIVIMAPGPKRYSDDPKVALIVDSTSQTLRLRWNGRAGDPTESV